MMVVLCLWGLSLLNEPWFPGAGWSRLWRRRHKTKRTAGAIGHRPSAIKRTDKPPRNAQCNPFIALLCLWTPPLHRCTSTIPTRCSFAFAGVSTFGAVQTNFCRLCVYFSAFEPRLHEVTRSIPRRTLYTSAIIILPFSSSYYYYYIHKRIIYVRDDGLTYMECCCFFFFGPMFDCALYELFYCICYCFWTTIYYSCNNIFTSHCMPDFITWWNDSQYLYLYLG